MPFTTLWHRTRTVVVGHSRVLVDRIDPADQRVTFELDRVNNDLTTCCALLDPCRSEAVDKVRVCGS